MAVCSKCCSECIIDLDPEDFDEATSSAAGGASSTVPDDLSLECGCHFHWQCLLDEASEIAIQLACPTCHKSILSMPADFSGTDRMTSTAPEKSQILICYINEGGTQNGLDIFPAVTEEAYLQDHPTARPARAFMTMCSEGDIGGIIELLESQEGDGDESMEDPMPPADILRYQDPLNCMRSALHVAIEESQEGIVWLLLWLASNLDSSMFPEAVAHETQSLGIGREIAGARGDIRGLRDESGRTAEDVARAMGGFWNILLQPGVLRA